MRDSFVKVAILALAAIACGDDARGPGPTDAGSGGVLPTATARPQVAFEGQQQYVVSITAEEADFTGAVVRAEDPSGALQVNDYRCNARRCGVRLSVRDLRANMGTPVPAPIDAQNSFLIVEGPAGIWRSLVSVRPLDTISNAGGDPQSVRGVQLAASIDVAPEAVLSCGSASAAATLDHLRRWPDAGHDGPVGGGTWGSRRGVRWRRPR